MGLLFFVAENLSISWHFSTHASEGVRDVFCAEMSILLDIGWTSFCYSSYVTLSMSVILFSQRRQLLSLMRANRCLALCVVEELKLNISEETISIIVSWFPCCNS